MSEYQYYEFQAIDRPLTDKEMSELRGHSTRARITATSFINHYDWGSFKGDPDKWMEKYFDAFLYFANWGTREIKLRLPSMLLDPATAQMYCYGESASVREKNGKVVLSLISQDEDNDWAEDEPSLSTLLGVRAELADGDLRSLYLGWLLQVQNGDLPDNNTEPPVPLGLAELSASLAGLADFLCIDCDLLHVAAQASVPLRPADVNQEKVRPWVAQLGGEEKDDLLTRLVIEGNQASIRELRQRYIKEHTAGNVEMQVPRRTVGELLKLAEAQTQERQRIEAEKRARTLGAERCHRKRAISFRGSGGRRVIPSR